MKLATMLAALCVMTPNIIQQILQFRVRSRVCDACQGRTATMRRRPCRPNQLLYIARANPLLNLARSSGRATEAKTTTGYAPLSRYGARTTLTRNFKEDFL